MVIPKISTKKGLASLQDEEDGKYFIDFSDETVLKEIILGVRCKTNIERIRECIGCGVDVTRAMLDSKEFKVVGANT